MQPIKKNGNKKHFIETYGCQMNVADSEVVAATLQERKYELVQTEEEADAVFMNTSLVRDNAEQKFWGRMNFYQSLKRKIKWWFFQKRIIKQAILFPLQLKKQRRQHS